MCRAATCKKCGKATWKGCGAHVEQVLGGVPKAQRCRCNEVGAPTVSVGAAAGGERARRKWFGR